jgi:hypothetical protein
MSISSAPAPIERKTNHRIAIRWVDGEAKVCQVQFADDGFFVHFPYHPDAPGVAARCVLPPRQTQTTVNLADSGYVTSHKVKYTHHVDGNCHFSQDGKVVTTVRNVARPLTSTAGHVFSLHVQGLARYAQPKAKDDAEMFDLGQAPAPGSARLVGRWLQHVIPPNVQNPIGLHAPPIHTGVGIAMCPAPGSIFDGFVLLVEAFEMQELDPNPPFIMAFVAGFGPDMLDLTKESTFLALQYPQTDPSMPSMDFVADATAGN